jgi:exodeoxyribonuclease V gamma subunit
MLGITFSNRFETLLDALTGRLERAERDPFAAQQVIVPSTAVARRIELALADRHGICANVEFSYLAQWLWRQIRRLVPEVREDSPFAPEVLAWRVYEALGNPGFIGEHRRLAAYLGKADDVMRLDLARHVAERIEQYITYRPEFLDAWSAGKRAPIAGLEGAAAEDEAWQAALWRRIAKDIGTDREHPSVAFFRRIEQMSEADVRGAGLPASAHVFCLPALPPLYLAILRRLAPWIDLQLYVLNPCQEYWFEIVDPKRLTYLTAAGKAEHHETGNALLAAWGKQTQAHIDLLLSGEGETEETDFVFEPPPGKTLLARVQSSILALEELPAASVQLAASDRSLEVHICHSLTRELEVLQDQLLMVLAGNDPPRPGEILVVTPNLDEAAPLIDAVFGTAPKARRVPYAITGQAQRRVNVIARALDSLLALTAGRHPASEVFDCLMQEPVAEQFGLDADSLESIRGWIEEAGIRWGLEAGERKDLGLPASADHTFADGLERLFAGYAMGECEAPIDRRIGSGNAEGQRAGALGSLWRFIEELRALRTDWRRPKNAAVWRDALGAALASFIAEKPEWSEEFRMVRNAIAELHEHMERGGLKAAVPLDVVRSALAERLDESARGGVPTGRVTFTSISSLRNLPYRMVCAIGMNDGVFPTAGRALEFDLIAAAPRRGDRQRRFDERNFFLDLMLAARERLYLSYTGRSVRDNSRKPPSVLVSELLDHAARAVGQAVRKQLVIEHPLQPFSTEYFDPQSDPRRRSFNAEYCKALLQKDKAAVATLPIKAEEDEAEETAPDIGLPLFAVPLPPPGPEWRTVRIEQLRNFFQSPCKFLLRDRLGLALGDREEELADDEPFLPDADSRRAIARRLLEPALEGASEPVLLELARAGNEFPAGPLGDATLAGEIRALSRFAAGVREGRASAAVAHAARLSFPIEGEEWRLEGSLEDLHAAGLVRFRYDDVKSIDYLAGWIDHLFLCATHPDTTACTTRWHSRDGIYVLGPYQQARERLSELIALYREGLREPLRFFPRAAWAFVIGKENLNNAKHKWYSYWRPAFGESQYAAYRLALRGVQDPLDGRFTNLANRILAPLRNHVVDPRL